MFKRAFLLGIVSGALAGVASLVYAWRYREALGTDFSAVAATLSIMAASIGGGVLAALGYWLSYRQWKDKGEIIFNLIFTILSFASILAPLAVTLPLDVEFPELFPGFAVPMHFFPALGWFTLKPLFIKQEVKNYDNKAGA